MASQAHPRDPAAQSPWIWRENLQNEKSRHPDPSRDRILDSATEQAVGASDATQCV